MVNLGVDRYCHYNVYIQIYQITDSSGGIEPKMIQLK